MTQRDYSASLAEFKQLAQFFEAFPNIPIPIHYSLAIDAPNDANGKHIIGSIANQVGLPITYDRIDYVGPDAEPIWHSVSVTIPIGRITYRVFYVSSYSMAKYAASIKSERSGHA